MAQTPPNEVPENPAPPAPATGLAAIGFVPMLALAVFTGIIVPVMAWMAVKEPELTPFEKTVQALEYLREGRTKTAYLEAIQMLDEGITDPEVGGALEFIVGVALFRKAERVTQEAAPGYIGITEPIYRLSMRYLERAQQKSIMNELVSEWRYTIGACYYKLGHVYEAREILEAAYEMAEENRADIALMLAQVYLDPNVLKSSLVHPTSRDEQHEKRQAIIENLQRECLDEDTPGERTEDRFLALYCVAELQRQDGEIDVAEQTLAQLEETMNAIELTEERAGEHSDTLTILKARLFLDQKKTEEARELLERIVTLKTGLEQKAVLQGHYLLGRSYAIDERYDLALAHFEKPAAVKDSQVFFPANLYAGDIARRRGLHEESLAFLIRGLDGVDSTEVFANPWMDLDEARDLVQSAWDEWGNSASYEQFRFSLELARHMIPLFTQSHANQLMALVSRKRAELVQAQYDAVAHEEDLEKLRDVREHWKRAGHAYARLANSSRASSNYGQILWEASQHYRRGNDFNNALQMLEMYIASNPRSGLTAAYIFKARLLLDLEEYDEKPRVEEAIATLEQALRDFPKDQLIYDAQFLLGRAYLEQGKTDEAAQVWRSLILESPLTPEAREWQQALFALGRMLFHVTETRPGYLLTVRQPAEPGTNPKTDERFRQVEEAIHWLDEFVRRIPNHPDAHEARWLLAKGLRFRARRAENRIKTAETENTRVELEKEIRQYLQRATAQYKVLADELARIDQRNELTSTSRQFLRDAYFEPAHIQFDLGAYDASGDSYRQAIDLYSNAAFYFTGKPVVLVAYYRIAECYRQLGAYAEARRQLEQARVILNQIPEPFPATSTNFSKQEWQQLLEQSVKLYDLTLNASAAP